MSEHQVWLGNMCFARLVSTREMNSARCTYLGKKRAQVMDGIHEVSVYDKGEEYICVCKDIDKQIEQMEE